MAGIFDITGKFSMEYTIGSGEPREVYVDGKCIYRTDDEAKRTKAPNNVPVEVEGWKDLFVRKYIDLRLHEKSRYGHRTTTYWLADNGLIPPVTEA